MNLNTLNILIVDDMQFSRESLRMALEKQGISSIHTAENALQAMKIVEKGDIDVVLVDKMMPTVDGPTLIKKLRKKHDGNHLKIILLTADDSEEALRDAMVAGADHYLYKDATGEKILNCVEYIDTQLRAKQIMQQLEEQEKKQRETSHEETVIFNVADNSEYSGPTPSDLSYIIVDDEEFAAESIKRVLERMDIRNIRIARNALSALKMQQKEFADVLLIDYMMPRVDGVKLAGLIRKQDQDMKRSTAMIMVTAAASIKKIEEAIKAGVDEYLYKPPGTRDLLKHIEIAYKKHNPNAELSQVNWLELF